MSNFRKELLAGQTLVETVAALAVAVVIIAALVGMAVSSLRSSNLSRSKAVATQLVTEEVERARIYRDLNGFAVLVSGIFGDYGNTPYLCPTVTADLWFDSAGNPPISGIETLSGGYLRSFTGCKVDADKMELTAKVSWTDSTGTHPIKVTTFFSSWK